MGTYNETRLSPAEARLRQKPQPLQPVHKLKAQYKGQDEGGLGPLKSFEMQRQQGEAAARRFRLQASKQQG
ncbi:MAG TPA: hypothetical protein VF449_11945 [Parvibaculum sp.]